MRWIFQLVEIPEEALNLTFWNKKRPCQAVRFFILKEARLFISILILEWERIFDGLL